MLFASKHEGLPIGYLTRPIEFVDPVTLIDPLLYKTGPHPWGNKSRGDTILGRRVWFLVILSIALCVLCNLMGPATAVLVIPSLQWITTDRIGDRQFTALNSAQPPKVDYDSWFWDKTYCYQDQIQNQEFSCTYNPFGIALDQWLTNGLTGLATTSQDGLTFNANVTGKVSGQNAFDISNKDLLFWAPSRQIVANLSTDTAIVGAFSMGLDLSYIESQNGYGWQSADPIDTYMEYNKSRALELVRNGPVLGAQVNVREEDGFLCSAPRLY